jgi:hypothetical protein
MTLNMVIRCGGTANETENEMVDGHPAQPGDDDGIDAVYELNGIGG